MAATNKFDDIYPDLARDGGIVNALQLALHSISSPLKVTGRGVARVEKNRRFSRVYTLGLCFLGLLADQVMNRRRSGPEQSPSSSEGGVP